MLDPLLRLAKGLLRPLAIRNVAEDGQDDGPATHADDGGGYLDRNGSAVGAHHLPALDAEAPLGPKLLLLSRRFGLLVGDDEVVVGPADELLAPRPEEALRLAVHLEDLRRRIEDQDRVVGLLHEGAIARFGGRAALERLPEGDGLAELQGEAPGEGDPALIGEVVAVGGQYELAEGLAEDHEGQDEDVGMTHAGEKVAGVRVRFRVRRPGRDGDGLSRPDDPAHELRVAEDGLGVALAVGRNPELRLKAVLTVRVRHVEKAR